MNIQKNILYIKILIIIIITMITYLLTNKYSDLNTEIDYIRNADILLYISTINITFLILIFLSTYITKDGVILHSIYFLVLISVIGFTGFHYKTTNAIITEKNEYINKLNNMTYTNYNAYFYNVKFKCPSDYYQTSNPNDRTIVFFIT